MDADAVSKLLTGAVAAETAAIVALFFLLLQAKTETIALAREAGALAEKLMHTVSNLQKLIERYEQRGGSP